ncbi:hypothetical protein LTR17_005609 [Elasticomyces elasticus]|nr:hypothetical protein LTR17_005609 [Elasticomyces elasticus]
MSTNRADKSKYGKYALILPEIGYDPEQVIAESQKRVAQLKRKRLNMQAEIARVRAEREALMARQRQQQQQQQVAGPIRRLPTRQPSQTASVQSGAKANNANYTKRRDMRDGRNVGEDRNDNASRARSREAYPEATEVGTKKERKTEALEQAKIMSFDEFVKRSLFTSKWPT